MAYILINSFKRGIDSRRSKISAQQGSLVYGKNVHVNRGGELEKRKAFVRFGELSPGDTFGLHATRFGLYVFGSKHRSVVSVPVGFVYQRLIAPSNPELVEVVSVDSFNSVPYVVARFANGSVHHFYNGKRVTDWDKLAPGLADLASLGAALADIISTDPEANAVYSFPGIHTITVTGSANNVSLSIEAAAENVGSIFNTVIVTVIQAATVSLPQITKIEFSGITVEDGLASEDVFSSDVWTVNIAGRAYKLTGNASGTGTTARTFRGKVYATVQGSLYFSDNQNPARWTLTYTDATGRKVDTFAGFESLSSQTGETENLVALAPYQNFLAIFSRRTTQIWQVVPGDPVDNQPQQILVNVGTFAPRSATNFGELDVFFLSDNGIRSLRARDSSNSAVVFDVGTSIDPLVVRQTAAAGEEVALRACGAIEPQDGRYMLAIGDTIFVYSFFPAGEISAWTTYDPGFSVDDFAVYGSSLYCRSGDTVYIYGGVGGQTYDSCLAEVELSWLDAEKPSHRKNFTGIDLSCSCAWNIQYSTDPNSEEFTDAGHVIGQNFSQPNFTLSSHGTHLGIRLSTRDAESATISTVCSHFEFAGAPG